MILLALDSPYYDVFLRPLPMHHNITHALFKRPLKTCYIRFCTYFAILCTTAISFSPSSSAFFKVEASL